MKDDSTSLRCPKCASYEIEENVAVWLDPNTGEMTDGEWYPAHNGDRYRCNACQHEFATPMLLDVEVRADGESNFWTLTVGPHWLMRIQCNGEIHTEEQLRMVEMIASHLTGILMFGPRPPERGETH